MALLRSENLEKPSCLRTRWESYCERWRQGIGATVEKSIYICKYMYIYIYIDLSTVAPTPRRHRSQYDSQRVRKHDGPSKFSHRGSAICYSEAVNRGNSGYLAVYAPRESRAPRGDRRPAARVPIPRPEAKPVAPRGTGDRGRRPRSAGVARATPPRAENGRRPTPSSGAPGATRRPTLPGVGSHRGTGRATGGRPGTGVPGSGAGGPVPSAIYRRGGPQRPSGSATGAAGPGRGKRPGPAPRRGRATRDHPERVAGRAGNAAAPPGGHPRAYPGPHPTDGYRERGAKRRRYGADEWPRSRDRAADPLPFRRQRRRPDGRRRAAPERRAPRGADPRRHHRHRRGATHRPRSERGGRKEAAEDHGPGGRCGAPRRLGGTGRKVSDKRAPRPARLHAVIRSLRAEPWRGPANHAPLC